MRRRKAKMALVRCNVKFLDAGYLSVIMLKKLAKTMLLLCNTINSVVFIKLAESHRFVAAGQAEIARSPALRGRIDLRSGASLTSSA